MYDYEWESWDWYVSKNTKHWKVCNRCVKNFDHHWIWLNNCIGYNNYRYFFCLLTIYWVYSMFFIVICLYTLWMFSIPPKFPAEKIFVAFLMWSMVIIKLIILWLCLFLLFFHIYLWKKGISTYEFIIRRRGTNRIEELVLEVDVQNYHPRLRPLANDLRRQGMHFLIFRHPERNTNECERP